MGYESTQSGRDFSKGELAGGGFWVAVWELRDREGKCASF